VFGCPVRFGQPIGEVVFDAAWLRLPVRSSNPTLHRLIRRHAEELLVRVPSDRDLLSRARTLLPELLPDPRLSLPALARRLGVTGRTLQRGLAEHGVTYKQLVDRAREEAAVRALEAGTYSVLEIATAIGFTSQAAFTRAFRRWRGTTPSQFQGRRAGKLLSRRVKTRTSPL
jgi:AraC-like DNA-binding protein